MSGAAVFFKGDVVKRASDGTEWLIEAKTQMQAKQSFSIKQEWFTKAQEETFATHKDTFAVVFNFGGEENISNNYYIITEKDFKRLVGTD